jgi:RHS repeat-associated protein
VYGSKSNVPDYMITSGGTYRILSDHLGSPRAVVDISSGNLIETINFDEFGNETDTLAGTLPTGYVRIPFGFAGGLYDPDAGLVRFGARDYDASVGRWTTKDPTLFDGGSLNLYGYVLNDPVNGVDSSGESGLADCLQRAAWRYLFCLFKEAKSLTACTYYYVTDVQICFDKHPDDRPACDPTKRCCPAN